jgi:Trp operon repressor
MSDSFNYIQTEKQQSGSNKEVFCMTAQTDEKEAGSIEGLTREAEKFLEKEDSKKDLKEKRGAIKQTLYDGSKKLKHLVPKGKHI